MFVNTISYPYLNASPYFSIIDATRSSSLRSIFFFDLVPYSANFYIKKNYKEMSVNVYFVFTLKKACVYICKCACVRACVRAW